MTDIERKLLEDEQSDNEPKIDYTHEYSDEFYEEYIKTFKQNQKSRWFYRFIKRAFDIVVSFIAC